MIIRGVILDVDGTLVDSNDLHAHAWVDALAACGFKVEFDRIRRLIGMGGDKLLPEVVNIEHESDLGQAISKRRSELFATHYLPQVKPFPQVRELLERMQAKGLTLVVASSAQAGELDKLLATTNATHLLQATTSSSEAKHSKPDPDIVQVALGKLGLEPSEAIMLGDTPYDIMAASKASVRVIALRCGGWGDSDLHGATAIYDNPADLLAHFDDSPLG